MNRARWTVATTLQATARDAMPGAPAAPPYRFADATQQALVGGCGAGKADAFVVATRFLPALTAQTWDLFASDFLTVFGRRAYFRVVRSLLVWVEDGGDSSGVRIGNAAADPWGANFGAVTQTATIWPGAGGTPWAVGSTAGIPVTATSRNLMVENLGAVGVTLGVFVAGGIAARGHATGVLGLTYP